MKDFLTFRDKIVFKIRAVCSLLRKANLFENGVSFLVVVKDEERTMKDCLLSILPVADEVILIDCSIKNDTANIVDSISDAKIKYCRRFKQEKRNWREHVEHLNYGLSLCRFKWVFKWDGDMVANTAGLRLWFEKLSSLKSFCVIDVPMLNLNTGFFGYFEGRLFTQDGKTKYKLLVTDSIEFPLWFKLIRFNEAFIYHLRFKKED